MKFDWEIRQCRLHRMQSHAIRAILSLQPYARPRSALTLTGAARAGRWKIPEALRVPPQFLPVSDWDSDKTASKSSIRALSGLKPYGRTRSALTLTGAARVGRWKIPVAPWLDSPTGRERGSSRTDALRTTATRAKSTLSAHDLSGRPERSRWT
jgi:hypothetical protein